MPPPDLTSSYLARQQQILSDIRDELRQSRTMGAPGGANANMGALGSPSVNAPWIHSQIAADKMLSGEWNTLGWSAAYSSHYKSTLSGDIMGIMGLRPAPATMHQVEFEHMASESLSTRAAALPFTLLTMGANGGFESRSREMAGDLMSYSGRFLRAGSLGAGPLGHGLGMAEANALARSLQSGAITDLRMNGGAYNEVMRGGLQSGQFDLVRNLDELKTKFSELKDSVAEVTRTNKLSVEETVRAFGQMRQLGIGEVSAQARALSGLGSIARVSGASFGEVASSAFSAVGAGFASGMNAEASMMLSGGNLAAIREASRAGVLSPGAMARGGGSLGIASAITSAQQRFMGSTAARLAARGGGGSGGFMGAMGRGLQFGGLDDMLAFEAQPMDMLDADQVAGLHTGFINQQLSMMGVTDLTSSRARNMAFALTRGDMGDAAAQAFADTNYTTGGQAAVMRQRFARNADASRSAALSGYDAHYNATSMMSRARLGMGAIGQALYGATDFISNKISPGQSGLFGYGGRYREDVAMLQLGVSSGTMGASEWAAYSPGSAAHTPNSIVLPGLGYGQAGAVAGGGLGALLGKAGGAAAIAGFGLSGPVGWGLGAAMLLGGGIGGAYAGSALGGMLGGNPVLSGDAAASYVGTWGASQRASADASRLTDAVLGSASFRKLSSQLDRTALSPSDSMAAATLVQNAAREAKVSEVDIISAYKGRGGQLELEKGVETFGELGKGSDLIAGLFKGKGMETTGLSGASPEFSRAASAYVKAYAAGGRDGNTKDVAKAEAGLQRIGISGAALMSFRENVAKMNNGTLSATGKALDAQAAVSMDATAKVALESVRKNLLFDTAQYSGKGAIAETAFDTLAKSSYEDLAADLFGNGKNRAETLELMRLAGGQSRIASEIQSSNRDFKTTSANELAAQFSLSGAEKSWLVKAQGEGTDSVAIKRALTMSKLGGLDQAEPEQKSQRLHDQAMQAITDTMKALAERLRA